MNLHETTQADNYLQSVGYRYNERRWLTRINNIQMCSNPPCLVAYPADVDVQVMLEGATDNNTGTIMHTDLNTKLQR